MLVSGVPVAAAGGRDGLSEQNLSSACASPQAREDISGDCVVVAAEMMASACPDDLRSIAAELRAHIVSSSSSP
jgi:hypothetical protein